MTAPLLGRCLVEIGYANKTSPKFPIKKNSDLYHLCECPTVSTAVGDLACQPRLSTLIT